MSYWTLVVKRLPTIGHQVTVGESWPSRGASCQIRHITRWGGTAAVHCGVRIGSVIISCEQGQRALKNTLCQCTAQISTPFATIALTTLSQFTPAPPHKCRGSLLTNNKGEEEHRFTDGGVKSACKLRMDCCYTTVHSRGSQGVSSLGLP